MLRLVLAITCVGGPALGDTIVAARTIRAQSILTVQDLVIKRGDVPGTASTLEQVVGLETRVALYAGRPVRVADIGPPAVIERNQIVPLIFEQNGLRISTEGRSLSRAGLDEAVRVMNLSSRTTVTGRVQANGRVLVTK